MNTEVGTGSMAGTDPAPIPRTGPEPRPVATPGRIRFERVVRDILGEELTFVLDADSDDWYATKMRGPGMTTPILIHLQALARLQRAVGADLPAYADIGANIGVSALYPARLGFRTLAVEAGARNLTLLAEAVDVNGLAPLCRPCLMATGSERGVAEFDEYSAWGSLQVQGSGLTRNVTNRRVVPLDA